MKGEMRAIGISVVFLTTVVIAVATAGLVWVFTTDDAKANEPQSTSVPTIRQEGQKLVLDNGGWSSFSGPVDRYVFRFTRDGVLVKGAASVPKTVPYGSPPLEGEYPNDPNANLLDLTSADAGHEFCGDVYAGTHSRYVLADGTVVYDVIEWGHKTAGSNGADDIHWTCVTVQGDATPPPPPPPASDQRLTLDVRLPLIRDNTLGELGIATATFSAYQRSNPGEWAKIVAYLGAIADGRTVEPPSLTTHKGRGIVGLLQASAATTGRLP